MIIKILIVRIINSELKMRRIPVSIRKERSGDIGVGQLYRSGDNLLDLNENPVLSAGRLS